MNTDSVHALEGMLGYIGNAVGLPQADPRHYTTVSQGHRPGNKVIRPDTDYVKIRGRKLRRYKRSTRKNIWDLNIIPEFNHSVLPVLALDGDNPNVHVYNHRFPFRSGVKVTDDTDAYFVMYSGFFLRNTVNAYFHKS